MLADLGDLHTYIGLKEIDGAGKAIPRDSLDPGKPFEWSRFFD